MVTESELQQIMPTLAAAKRQAYLPHLQKAMQEFGITSFPREAAFLAQLAHESGELRWMEEIADGSRYEGRRDLGNTQAGDGKRYKGRGPIQLTGRANYKKYGDLLKLDLINNPKQAATPEVGFRIAALFWKSHGLNELADSGEFVTITRRINGGTNGLADRQKYYERAKLTLSKNDTVKPVTVIVNGKPVGDAQPFLRDGELMVALRPVAKAAEWNILKVENGHATLRDGFGANHDVVVVVKDGTGFARWLDLPGETRFDATALRGTLNAQLPEHGPR